MRQMRWMTALLLAGTVAGTVALGQSPGITPRHEHGYVQVGDRFYLLGGRRIQPVDIFDPVTGRSANRQAAVSVTASRAMVADVLSTVLMIIPADAGKRLLVTFGPATAYLFAFDSTRTTIRAVPKTPSGTIPTLRSHGIDAIGACLLGKTAPADE